MANIRIIDSKGNHIQTWGISDKDIPIYFEMIMSRFDWEDKGKKEYLKIMNEKSIKDVVNLFKKRKIKGIKHNDK